MIKAEISQAEINKAIGKLDLLLKKKRNQVEVVINHHALKIESAAKNRVPTDSGRLKSSIKTEKLGELGRKVYTNVEYAPYVEFGTYGNVETTISGVDYSSVALPFKRSNGGPGGMPGRSFLFRSFEEARPKIIKDLKKVINAK